MEKWFVRAKRGNTQIKLRCHDVRETTIFGKKINFKPAKAVAFAIKKILIGHGWEDVKVIKSVPE